MNVDVFQSNSHSQSLSILELLAAIDKLPAFWLHCYFKYLGTLIAERVRIRLASGRYELFVSRAKLKFRSESASLSLKVLDAASRATNIGSELFVNKLVLSSLFNGAQVFGVFRLEVDSVNLGMAFFKVILIL